MNTISVFEMKVGDLVLLTHDHYDAYLYLILGSKGCPKPGRFDFEIFNLSENIGHGGVMIATFAKVSDWRISKVD